MGFRILEASAMTQGNPVLSQIKFRPGQAVEGQLREFILSLKELGGAGDQGKTVLHTGFQLHTRPPSGSFLALRVIPFFPS